MQRFKPYVLPVAIILGLLFHDYCSLLKFLVPYLIFLILFFAFCAVDLKKLRPSTLDLWLMAFQVIVSTGIYCLLRFLGADTIIAEGVLIGVLCPVAASVSVISCMLGANRETVTTYTILGNLMVTLVAPVVFTCIGVHPELSFLTSFLLIIGRIAPMLAAPLLVVLALQKCCPKCSQRIAKLKDLGFWAWSLALLLTLGQTIDYIFLHGKDNWDSILWLGLLSLLFCALQFGLGKLIGHHYGDSISGGQLLGQKNTAMGIWMANTFLHPLASVFMAFYSIYQNLFNSWQIWHHSRVKR